MKNKILIMLVENYVPGGANKYIEDLAYCLENSFAQIEIWGNRDALTSFNKVRLPKNIHLKTISIFNAGELSKSLPIICKKLISPLLIFLFFILNIISLFKLKLNLDRLKPSMVLLCNGGYPASIYLDMAPLFIKSEFSPSMTIVSTPVRNEKLILSTFWKVLDQIVISNCKKIVVNSLAIKNELVEKYQFPIGKISVLKNGVFDQPLLRQASSEIIHIGFISRVEKTKGVEELLDAYTKLKLKHKKINLIIAGGGSLSPKVKEAAKLDPTIHYLGHIGDGLNELLHKIDIFVLPSYQEGLPYSVIEASMSGCAIIASNVGGIPELVEDKKTGLLIPPKDELLLYESLDSLICDHDLRVSLGLKARQNFIENLSIDKMQEQARKIFL